MRGEADEAVLDLLDGDAVGDDGVARVREDALDVAELVACGLEAVVVVRRRGGEERGHHPQREHRQRGDERDEGGPATGTRTWYWDHATAVMTKSVSQGMTYTR